MKNIDKVSNSFLALFDQVSAMSKDERVLTDTVLMSVRIIIDSALEESTTVDQKKKLAESAIKRLKTI